MPNQYPGINFHEEDRGKGPFAIRIAGTKDFVSKVQSGYYSRWGQPIKRVALVEGWDHPSISIFQTMDEALQTAKQVWEIEALHTSIEIFHFSNQTGSNNGNA